MAELDELFGEREDAPRARTGRVWGLLAVGLVLAGLGLLCSSAPGGILVLVAWMLVEKEMDRVENGYLPADQRPVVVRARAAAVAGLALSVAIFVLQGLLFCNGWYEVFWPSALDLWYGGLGG